MILGEVIPLLPGAPFSDPPSARSAIRLPPMVSRIMGEGGIPAGSVTLIPRFYGAIPGLTTSYPQMGAGLDVRFKF